MQPLRFHRLRHAEILGLALPVASTFPSRLLGLSLLPRHRAGAGLLIPGCRSVHTFGMRFALDLIWLDAERQVIRIDRGLSPRRIVHCPGATAVVELPSP